jgi:hypothetical protein
MHLLPYKENVLVPTSSVKRNIKYPISFTAQKLYQQVFLFFPLITSDPRKLT